MFLLLLSITVLVSIGYAVMLFWIYKGWSDTPEWEVSQEWTPKTSVTIVIAARNEERYIAKCIDSVLYQNYPTELVNVIVVDDQSTDRTLELLQEYDEGRLSIITNTKNIGKKAAISLAISQAKSTLIACTDADSTVTPDWLNSMISYYESHHPKLIAGPIVYTSDDSVLQRFQYLDGVNNMATTAAGIHYNAFYMANGANMVYEKSLFDTLNGYDDDKLASGDDMMLVQRAAKSDSNSVHFVKNKAAIVTTQPVLSLSALIQQRKRWATKSKQYTDRGIIYLQAYVFLVIMLLLMHFLLMPFGGQIVLISFLSILSIKLLTDYIFLSKMTAYFGNKAPLKSFLTTSLWYVLYILWATWNAIFPSTYVWKDRTVT